MTPEEKKLLAETIEALKLPEQSEPEDLAPVAMQAEEIVQEVQVEIPDLPEQADHSPIADALEVLSSGQDQPLNQDAEFPLLDDPVELPEPPPKEVQVHPPEMPGLAEFQVQIPPEPNFDSREAGAASIPAMEEFMRDMAKEGKLSKDGFLADSDQGVNIAPDEMEELLQTPEPRGGDAMLAWMRAQEAWQAEVVRAFKTHTVVTQKNTCALRDITDGLMRGET